MADRLKARGRRALSRMLARRGYRLVRDDRRITDMRSLTNHPRSFLYHRGPVLVDAPASLGRGHSILPFDAHPWVRGVALASGSHDEAQTTIRGELARYCDMTQPRNLGEWYGLADGANSQIHAEPPTFQLLPWDLDAPTIEGQQAARQAGRVAEARRQGVRLTTIGADFCGPASDEWLDVETKRLHSLLESVRRHGLIRTEWADGDIAAQVLFRQDGQWRWLVRNGGHHRASVAVGLGHRSLTVRVIQVVDQADVDLWPGVVNGTYARDDAVRLFDTVFAGAATPATQEWHRYCAGQPVPSSLAGEDRRR